MLDGDNLTGESQNELLFPTKDEMAKVRSLMEAGLSLKAWNVVSHCSDYRMWPEGESRRLAALIGSRLGSHRWSNVLDWKNWKSFPENDDYFYRAQFVRLGKGRWWEAMQAISARLKSGVKNPNDRADMQALQGWFLGNLRDFERAFPLLDQAIANDEKRAWPWVEKAAVLQTADRREEALEAVEQALVLKPLYRPAVLLQLDLLEELRRKDEMEEILKIAHRETELGSYSTRLHALCSERDQWQSALDYLDEYEALSPLLDKGGQEWLAGRRADLYLDSGEVTRFFTEAEKTGKVSYQKRVAKHLKETEGQSHQRKKLSVPFIRQHSMTCAPATLASIAAFWGKEHDHLQIADAICYDGTPWHKERNWARENGFETREFKITRESAKALLNRGVPFTLSTAWATGAHLQACVGYDEFQDALVIRDPTNSGSVEMSHGGLEEQNPIEGPRGMVLIPKDKIELLEGLSFPDEAVYDAHHDFASALSKHNRPEAKKALVQMEETAGKEHPFVWWCRQRLASYDSNASEELVWLDRLVERFPKVERFRYWRLNTLYSLARRDAREKSLREIVGQKKCSTVFYSELGELYAEDDRDYVLANHFLQKAMRVSPTEEVAYASLARAKWARFEREEATELYRLASTLNCFFEPYANSYFQACVSMGQRDEGLAFLKERVENFGQKQGGPWLTLIEGYFQLNRVQEAKAKLEEACLMLPNDGQLLLEAAERQSSWGEAEEAWKTMERAKGHVGERQWYEAVGRMAGFLGERKKALAAWEKVASLAPALMPAHRALARIYEEEKAGAALGYLREKLLEQPEHPSLLGLFADWCGAEDAAEAEEALRRGLAIQPNWPWAIRERALQLELLKRNDEALMEARRAAELASFDSGSWGILAGLLWRQDRDKESEDCAKKALRLEIDYTWAIDLYMTAVRKRGVGEEGLEFLKEEIEKQVSTGEVVFSYRQHAYRHREPKDLLVELKRLCEQRPDLWQTWSAVKDQSMAMNDLIEAKKATEELVRRFPLLPRSYTERAEVSHAAGSYDAEITDLQKALEISPSWDFAARRLSEALERCERSDEALEVLKQASNAEPLVAANHGMVARLLAMKDEKEESYQRMKQAVRVDSSYDYGWGELANWSLEQERVSELRDLLAEVDPLSQHLAGWWDTKRRILQHIGDEEEAFAVATDGVKRFPRSRELRDQLILLHCDKSNYEEALRACQPPENEGPWDRMLAGRHAWVQMEAGYPREAIEATRKLVEKEPDYVWAWGNLMRWHYNRQNWEECLEASTRVIRLDPEDSTAWGHRGDAARSLDKMEEAEESFEKAYLLDPDYRYGGRELLEIYVNKGSYGQAREIWKSLTHYTPDAFILVDGMTIELADKQLEQVTEMTDELLANDFSDSADPLEYAEWAFDKHKQTALWDERLSQKMKENPSRAIVNAWMRASLKRGNRTKAVRRLKKMKLPFEQKAGAWSLLLENFYAQGESDSSNELIRKNWSEFRSDQETWTEGGYNLLHMGKADDVSRWYRDWKERGEQVSARDYLNITTMALRNHNLPLAREVAQTGLFRFRTGVFAESLRVVRRFLDELEDRVKEADQLAHISEPAESLPFYQAMNQLSEAMLHARQGQIENAENEFKEVAKEWQQWTGDPVYATYFNLSAEKLAKAIPKYKGKTNKFLRQMGSKRIGFIEKLAGKFGDTRVLFAVLFAFWMIFRLFQALIE